MGRRAWFAVALALLIGCTSSFAPAPTPVPVPHVARLTVTLDAGFFKGPCRINVYSEDNELSPVATERLMGGESANFLVPAPHRIFIGASSDVYATGLLLTVTTSTSVVLPWR